MPDFQPAHLARITKGDWHGPEPESIRGFSFDTRKIQSGFCFVALKSESRDGHDFLNDALARGVACALTNRVVDCALPQLVVSDPLTAMAGIAAARRGEFSGPVVGITGSCGKTSTKEMLRLLLGGVKAHATSGNWNNRIGVPMTLFDLDPAQHDFAVIEAGINQPGEMVLLGEMINGDMTVLTNIGPAHLELLGSLGGIADEKSKLAEAAKADSPIVLPIDVLQYQAFSRFAGRCLAVRFDDASPSCSVRELVDCRIELAKNGTVSTFSLGGHTYQVQTSSRGILQNAALAVVAARALGIEPEQIAERLRSWQPESTRGRIVTEKDAFYFIDCYNANPASMVDSLGAFQNAAPPDLPRCYVIGAMNELGACAVDFHVSVGKQVRLRKEDMALFVGPAELTQAFSRGLQESGASNEQIQIAESSSVIKSTVADFKGALFLKGSRSYQLEQLLPDTLDSN